MSIVISTFLALFNAFMAAFPRLFSALLILLATLALASWAKSLIRTSLGRMRGIPASSVTLLSSLANVGIIAIGLLAVLNLLGLGQLVLSTITSLGVVGLILGFALQDITKQFASGILLTLARPFELGDTIRVGDHEGTVIAVELRATSLRTTGGDLVIIPNADVYVATVYNLSRYPQRRSAVPIQFPYTADLESLREQVLAAVRTIPGVAASPPPSVVCLSVADQKVSAEVRYWIERNSSEQDEISTLVIVAVNRVTSS